MLVLFSGFFCLTDPGSIAYADDPSSPVVPVTDSSSTARTTSLSSADSQATSVTQAVPGGHSETTLEFMMGNLPIQAVPEAVDVSPSSPGVPATSQAVAAPGTVPTPGVIPGPVPGTGNIVDQLQSVAQDPDSVAMLVSETCEQSGDASEGTVTCRRTYSNGNYAIVITQRAAAGDEFKLQCVIREYDKDGNLLYTKTIRQRIDYNYHGEDRGKERELIDIVYEPVGGQTTRELIIFQFDLETGKVKSMTWAQYTQIGDQPRAGLVYHATLHYDPNGDPLRGVAERWDQGRKVASYLNWSALSQGRLGFDQASWHEWESWIQSISLQAYLP